MADADLAKLESDVILSSLAANLLPPHLDSERPEQPVPPDEAGKVVEDFKELPLEIQRWVKVRSMVRLIGGVTWLGVEITTASKEGNWKNVAFPVCHLIRISISENSTDEDRSTLLFYH